MGEAIEAAVSAARFRTTPYGAEFERVMGPADCLEVVADPLRLRQIMVNLLVKGAKYGGRPPRVRIRARLTDTGPIPYPADAADKPLETGMVLSIETTLPHPKRGFIKLEDTVAVTADGWEAFGDRGRGWNRGGTAR